MNHAGLLPFARSHHGLVTLGVFRAAGHSRASWYRALDDGRLEAMHPAVARLASSSRTWEQSVAAAVLAAGKGAIASHRSAARLWGISRPASEPPEIILPARNRGADLHGVIVHRPRDLLDLGGVSRSEVPTSNVVRMLCDLGAVDSDGVHGAVGHALTSKLVTHRAIHAAICVHGRRGRPGTPAVRAALDDWVVDGDALDSELERRMIALIRRHDLPPVTFHARLCGYEVDFLVTGTRVVLECDGWEYHDKQRSRFERDRRRDAELAAAGYVVVRFTYVMLMRDPRWVAAMIRQAVRQFTAGSSG